MTLYLGGADRDRLDPILDACVATYNSSLDENGQVNFKGKAKAFVRTYGFLASVFRIAMLAGKETVDFLEFPRAEIACSDGRGPFQRADRDNRHGQLSR